jgi:methenyltetrahydrofolate cyclohydrolase
MSLLELPTRELLLLFSAGRPTPGVGSASALAGCLAGSLASTVVQLTRGRNRYEDLQHELDLIEAELHSIRGALGQAIDNDAHIFKSVIEARRERKLAADKATKEFWTIQARRRLIPAAELPLLIADHCVRLVEHCITLFDLAFQSARGDSATAASLAIAAADGSLAAAFLNIDQLRDEGEFTALHEQAVKISKAVDANRDKMGSRLRKLQA